MIRFRDLQTGDTFNFVNPNPTTTTVAHTFFDRCTKISKRQYEDESGNVHQVGTINVRVFHVERAG